MLQKAAHKSKLSPQALIALGKVSPELAWLQLRGKFQEDLQEYRGASEELAKREHLPESLESLGGSMQSFHPIPAINFLLESNPDLDLQNIDHLPPLTVVKAIMRMMLTNDRLLSP